MAAPRIRPTAPGPLVVELFGPAGAGKSTLAGALARRLSGARRLTMWGLPRPDLLAAAARAAPLALRAAGTGRPVAVDALAQMARIDALGRMVDRLDAAADPLVLDEGPVFGLAWLDVFHPAASRQPTSWRRRVVAEWAGRLDVVVGLDAADDVLAARIRTRRKTHPVKNLPDREISAFTARFRDAFDRVVEELQGHGPIRRLRVHGVDGPARDAAARLAARIREAVHVS